jgi:peptide-methionine (R)-S-oxide reductase
MPDKIEKTQKEWRQQLSDEQFEVARCGGTEPAFTGEYWDNHDPGMYRCVCCGEPLFDSQTKFESGSGWPSFYQPVDPNNVELLVDRTHGMTRTEVKCSKCGAHLGHVFPDGPRPTGRRFCMNSASLSFQKKSAG